MSAEISRIKIPLTFFLLSRGKTDYFEQKGEGGSKRQVVFISLDLHNLIDRVCMLN
jgi:hypothetical protein